MELCACKSYVCCIKESSYFTYFTSEWPVLYSRACRGKSSGACAGSLLDKTLTLGDSPLPSARPAWHQLVAPVDDHVPHGDEQDGKEHQEPRQGRQRGEDVVEWGDSLQESVLSSTQRVTLKARVTNTIRQTKFAFTIGHRWKSEKYNLVLAYPPEYELCFISLWDDLTRTLVLLMQLPKII